MRVLSVVLLTLGLFVENQLWADPITPKLKADGKVEVKPCADLVVGSTDLDAALSSGGCTVGDPPEKHSIDWSALSATGEIRVAEPLELPTLDWTPKSRDLWLHAIGTGATGCSFKGTKEKQEVDKGACVFSPAPPGSPSVGRILGTPPLGTTSAVVPLAKGFSLRFSLKPMEACDVRLTSAWVYSGAVKQTLDVITQNLTASCKARLRAAAFIRFADGKEAQASYDDAGAQLTLHSVPVRSDPSGAVEVAQVLNVDRQELQPLFVTFAPQPEVLAGARIRYEPGVCTGSVGCPPNAPEDAPLVDLLRLADGGATYAPFADRNGPGLPVLAIDPTDPSEPAGVVNDVPIRLPPGGGNWTVTMPRYVEVLDVSTPTPTWRSFLVLSQNQTQTVTLRIHRAFAGEEIEAVFEQPAIVGFKVRIGSKPTRFSVPVPAQEVLKVKCERQDVDHNETRSIDNAELADGKCAVVVGWRSCPNGFEIKSDHEGICVEKGAKKEVPRPPLVSQRLSLLFGPQRILETVSRQGATTLRITHPVATLTASAQRSKLFSLSPPTGDDNGTGAYTVELRPSGRGTSGAVAYRLGENDTTGATSVDYEELSLRVRLLPRGLFGWPCDDDWGGWAPCNASVRTYVTLGVPLTGVRFRASPRKLSTSSDPTVYQFVGPRLNALFTVEPWNYDKGENSTLVGMAFQGGLAFLDLGGKEFEAATLVGVSFLLPLVADASYQLGSSLAVGAFWEKDLVVSDPASGHHFLLQLGFNIGSLLSGAQGSK